MGQETFKLALIIVTYNRKELLLRCMKASIFQSYLPESIFIIDNASTDGTYDSLQQNGLLKHDVIDIQYFRLNRNEGGSGGFYFGLKTAHESGKYDGYVLMDDDGVPDKDELKYLSLYMNKYDYINAFVLSENDFSQTAFPRKSYGFNRSLIEKECTQDGLILNYSAPFNGTLYSRKLVDKIGYPIQNMFFQGDEANYHKRAIKAGFIPVTIVKSIHYHPCKIPQIYHFSLGIKSFTLSIEDTPLRIYCKHRNLVYNRFSIYDYGYIVFTYFLYSYLYLFMQKSWKNYIIFNRGVWDGIFKRMGGHYRYLHL